MSVTISTHNGPERSEAHNRRDPRVVSKEDHIYKEGEMRPNGRPAHSEIWHDEYIRQAYQRIFGEAVSRYNEKQTREDRKVDDYLRQVRKDKARNEAYEMIIGVYDADLAPQTCKAILRTFVDEWKARNPNLELIGAYYHDDEQGKNPHVHIDYVPVAHNYARGMDTQNGLVKAFGEMGFEGRGTKVTAQILWERRENQALEDICRKHGLTVEHPQRGKEKQQHRDTAQYKAEERLKSTEKEISTANQILTAKKGQIERLNEQADKARSRRRISRKRAHISMDEWLDHTEVVRERDALKSRESEVNAESIANGKARQEIADAQRFINQAQAIYREQEENWRIIKEREKKINAEVERRAEELATQKRSAYTHRLEEHCRNVKYKDGTSILDEFKALEKERNIDRGWSR